MGSAIAFPFGAASRGAWRPPRQGVAIFHRRDGLGEDSGRGEIKLGVVEEVGVYEDGDFGLTLNTGNATLAGIRVRHYEVYRLTAVDRLTLGSPSDGSVGASMIIVYDPLTQNREVFCLVGKDPGNDRILVQPEDPGDQREIKLPTNEGYDFYARIDIPVSRSGSGSDAAEAATPTQEPAPSA